MSHSRHFMSQVTAVAKRLEDMDAHIEAIVAELATVRERKGRLFIIGIGGGAGHASHAVNDFRKLCGIEAYAPTDNVSELTARANDEGFDTIFSEWLKVSRIENIDALLIFSVGGGNVERQISMPIVKACELAGEVGAKVLGVVGRADGMVARVGYNVVVVPIPKGMEQLVTPLTEAFQCVVWHSIVSHPALKVRATTW